MKARWIWALLCATLYSAGAMSATGIVTLEDYLKGVESSTFDDYENLKQTRVADEQSFVLMQEHLLTHYDGVLVTHSFLSRDDRVVDCVVIETQPSLQTPEMRSHKIAKPPKALVPRDEQSPDPKQKEAFVLSGLGERNVDKYLNPMYCQDGTIPMLRLSLESMTRFYSLDDFFSKGPLDPALADDKQKISQRELVPGEDDYTHYWAHAYQNVNNHGGDSRLNVWQPDAEPGWFSLAQHWYVGGSGADRQTVEGGWQVAERKYDNVKPNLFIYSTSANYSSGSGCYNLDCAAFVQINNTWLLGGPLGPVSTYNGTQFIFRMQWQLYEGNWWLFLKGRGAAEPGVANYFAIGYYPESHFDGGQLTEYATKVDYGGEVSSLLGEEDTGEMGSGKFASEGWKKAAYQRTIYYIDTAQTSHWANLTKVNNTASCYTADVHNNTGGNWATYLFFGGEKCPNP